MPDGGSSTSEAFKAAFAGKSFVRLVSIAELEISERPLHLSGTVECREASFSFQIGGNDTRHRLNPRPLDTQSFRGAGDLTNRAPHSRRHLPRNWITELRFWWEAPLTNQ